MSRTSLSTALLLVPTLALAQGGMQLDPAKIDAVFKDYGTSTPGCALGIYERGAVRYAKGYGMADLNLGVAIRPETVFDIGSTSKQFAAAAVVLLANEGKLALTDDVRKYVPELPSYGTVITIDHMLRHTSGLRDYNGLLYLAGHFFEDFTGDDEALAVITKQRALNFEPGSRWDYSNTGFFLLSTIVKRVSGRSLPDFAKERIFGPLGMTVSHFRVDHRAILPNRATAYAPSEGGGFEIDMSDWDQAGDGAVNTNVIELAKWDANFYQPTVGGRGLIDRLEERGTLNNGDSLGYARGLFVDKYRGLRRIHHGGSWAGYRAMLMRFPDRGMSVGLTCNVGSANTDALAEGVADAVLGSAFPEPKAKGAELGAKPEPFDASANLGTYFSDAVQSVVRLEAREGIPTMMVQGSTFPLRRVAPDRLATVGVPIELIFGVNGRLDLVVLGDKQGPFSKVDAVEVGARELAELVGSYHSPELTTTWTLRMEGERLVLKGRAVGEMTMESAIKDGYRAGRSFLKFTRGKNGRVNGFDLSSSRMLRIRFDRQ